MFFTLCTFIPLMTLIETNELTTLQKEALWSIWNHEYPAQLNYRSLSDFDNYLNNLTEKKHYLLVTDDDLIKGWAFTFTRDSEKWFAVILDLSFQQQGHGTRLLNKIKEEETVLNGWVIDHNKDLKSNGFVYQSPLEFYVKNNFTVSGTRLETATISAVKIVWSKK
jgi:GNAT superfamily N-acetyltransferase